MNYTRKTAPAFYPVEVDIARRQCRLVEGESDDVLLLEYIKSATEWVEDYTGRGLPTQTWQCSLESFPLRLWLPYAAPLGAVSFVKYYDASNVLQTLDPSVYTVAAFSEPACLALAYAQVWPVTYDRDDAVQIEYTVGAAAALVPGWAKQAIRLLVGHQHEQREPVIVGTIASSLPFGVKAQCAPHRLFLRQPQWA